MFNQHSVRFCYFFSVLLLAHEQYDNEGWILSFNIQER